MVVVLRVRSNHLRNRKIAEVLDRIRLAAETTRSQSMARRPSDLSGEFEALKKLAPGHTGDHVRRMEDTYEEIMRRTDEFLSRDSMTTLQSSVATLKTDKLVADIQITARKIEIQLGDPNKQMPD